MKLIRGIKSFPFCFAIISTIFIAAATCNGQPQAPTPSITTGRPGRPVTIPLTIHLKETQREVELQNIDITVSEDGEPQTVLSLRGFGTGSPITLALLIQEDLLPPIGNEIKPLAEFI